MVYEFDCTELFLKDGLDEAGEKVRFDADNWETRKCCFDLYDVSKLAEHFYLPQIATVVYHMGNTTIVKIPYEKMRQVLRDAREGMERDRLYTYIKKQ